MLRIVTLNLNGIRSAVNKGLLPWLETVGADMLCVQELKARDADLTDAMRSVNGLTGWFHHAEKPGYSGVGIYTRHAPDRVIEGLGLPDIDAEGRYLQSDFGNLSIVSLYLPSGSSSEARLAVKFDFMARFIPRLHELAQSGRDVVVCGDWNIAHKEIDLANPVSNRKNSGFLPEERTWITHVFDEIGFVDVFRRLNNQPDQYTWWSNRGDSWNKNVGWRIDYHVATGALAKSAKKESIYKARRFSDHAPLTIDYDWKL